MFDTLVIGRDAQFAVHGGPVLYESQTGGQGVVITAIYDPEYIRADQNGGFGNEIQAPERRLLVSQADITPKDGDHVTILAVQNFPQPDEGLTFVVRAPKDAKMGMWAMTLETPGSEATW